MTDEELMGRWALIIQALKFKTRFQGKCNLENANGYVE